jgi:hypothetical protein
MRRFAWILVVVAACGHDEEMPAEEQPDAGAGPDASEVEPAPLSDEFDGTALDASWDVKRGDALDIDVRDGALHLAPTSYLLWYQENEGAMISKLLAGDFSVRARVRARRASEPSQPPAATVHLGGLAARDPASDQGTEDYVFVVVGRDVDDLSVETKTTDDGVSTYVGPTWPSGDAELRMCREGATFTVWKRAIGGATWTLAATYDRPDLPSELQVGGVVYAPVASPDLDVAFEEIVFEPGCQ